MRQRRPPPPIAHRHPPPPIVRASPLRQATVIKNSNDMDIYSPHLVSQRMVDAVKKDENIVDADVEMGGSSSTWPVFDDS